MELEEVLLLVEHPQAVGRRAPGHLLDRDVGDDVDAELRPQPADQLAQQDTTVGGRYRFERTLIHPEQLALQRRYRMDAVEGEAEADDDGLDVEVGVDRDQRVLDALHDQQLVEERIVRSPGVAHPGLEGRLLQRPHGVDHQHLEIGAAVRQLLSQMLGGLDLALGFGGLLRGAQRDGPTAVGVAAQGADDAAGERAEIAIVLGVEQAPQAGDRVAAGKHPIAFDRLQEIERLGHAVAQSRQVTLVGGGLGEPQGVVLETVPGIGPQLAGVVILAEGQLATLRPLLGLDLVHPLSPARMCPRPWEDDRISAATPAKIARNRAPARIRTQIIADCRP